MIEWVLAGMVIYYMYQLDRAMNTIDRCLEIIEDMEEETWDEEQKCPPECSEGYHTYVWPCELASWRK